eukprot:TRINITY_DN30883_c0_g1_i1.p2 TRINITY_DN30883_c0_g1~~TRINITY_DN30883_c0_g1_i1.p2  ORF type:complete len:822 (-),score=245.08 TRINITY_DN30883_c0_g1_i1:122-2587(-)
MAAASAREPLTGGDDEQEEEENVGTLGRMGAMGGNLAHGLDLRARASVGGHRYADVPLMKGSGEIVIDDTDCTIVMVFDYDPEAEKADASALDAMVENPMSEAAKIFDRETNQYSANWKDSGFENFRRPVTKREYRDTVWRKIMELLEQSGFKLSSTPSIDKDQIFLRVKLMRNGSVIEQLAQRFRYTVAYNAKCYESARPLGSWFDGKKPPSNYNGEDVQVVAPYKIATKEKFEDFKEIDEIRLIMAQINEWILLEQCVAQGIMVGVFPMASFDSVVALNQRWAAITNIVAVPSHDMEDMVRDYFGEKIAFIIMWVVSYTQALSFLATIGLIGLVAKLPGMPLWVTRATRWLFCAVICIWAAVFNQNFKNRTGRLRQRWGMENCENLLRMRTDWNPMLEGTWLLTFRRMGVQVGAMVYLVLFMYVIGVIANMRREAKETGATDYSEILITVVIQAGGWVYGRTAHLWVSLQNHRSQNHWEDAVSVQLVLVKLFIALYPFINFAFLQTYTDPTCGKSLKDAAELVYKGGFPKGTDGKDLAWLDTDTFRYTSGSQTCIYGCFPEKCERDAMLGGSWVCVTNCVSLLESALLTNFLTVNVIAIGLMIAPIFIIRAKIFMERRKLEQLGQDAGSFYSWIQVQAKCLEVTPYEYYSWGGSVMEDFLEYVVAFSLVVCFGMMLPVISIVAFLSTMVYGRLTAFRFANVTCRPFPDAADGIGVWQSIISTVCTLACVINAGLVTIVMPPIRDWPRMQRLLAFLALQHLLLFVQVFVGFVIPDEPDDVRIIRDINTEFAESQAHKVLKAIPDSAKADYSEVNLSLTDQ